MTHYHMLHDNELGHRASEGDAAAQEVLDLRTKAAAAIRLGLARVYGRGDMATFSRWSVVPCLTPEGTLGILDVARGTAWATDWPLDEEACRALGLERAVEARVNNAAAGARVTVGEAGPPAATPDGPRAVTAMTVDVTRHAEPRPSMPEGWRQVTLYTWRGHEGVSPYRPTPPSCFRPETWIRPRLAAAGLMTCYGRPGDESDGEQLCRTHGWDSQWPWGVPEWIDGTSVTVLDVLADGDVLGIRRTRRPRRSDAEELELARQSWRVAGDALARMLSRAAKREEARRAQVSDVLQEAARTLSRDDLGPAEWALREARWTDMRIRNTDLAIRAYLRAGRALEEDECAWSAVKALVDNESLARAVAEALL